VNELLRKFPRSMESLLDILHAIQDADPQHHLSDEALQAAAEYLGAPLSEVVSTATFYTMYSRMPRGRHIIRLCESPPCQLLGGETLLDILAEDLGVAVGETAPDGAFTLETTSCLGACAEGPAMMVDDRIYGALTKEKVLSVIAEVRRSDATR